MRATGPVHLDASEYTATWRPRGEKPTLLHTPDHGATLAARDALDADAWARLGERGLARATAPEPVLDDLLSVLAVPDVEMDVRLWAGGPARATRGILAAARAEHGVVAELDDAGGLRVEPVDVRSLASALLARLPTATALPGVPMTVPSSAMGAPDAAERERRLRRAGVARPTMRRLTGMWSAPPRRVLQFGVARRGSDGRRRRGSDVLDVVDAEPGRLALVRDAAGRHLTIRPADPTWLCAELSARLEAL